jgi:hypothetical protein
MVRELDVGVYNPRVDISIAEGQTTQFAGWGWFGTREAKAQLANSAW